MEYYSTDMNKVSDTEFIRLVEQISVGELPLLLVIAISVNNNVLTSISIHKVLLKVIVYLKCNAMIGN